MNYIYNITDISIACKPSEMEQASKNITTRSQAVARIADRTAKNCKRHVT